MGIRHLILYLSFGSLLISVGCSKRIFISYDAIKPNAWVKIETVSGQTCDGVIQEKKFDHLLLKINRHASQLTKINREDIASISGREFVYDGLGAIISEWEIEKNKNNKNLLLYTIGGAGLSFGASFFIGSLIHRNVADTEQGSKILWGTTAAGMAAGTYLFAKTGKKRDRWLAIEKIREERFNAAKNQFDDRKKKHDLVQQQLEKEKADREKQEQELKLLQEKVKNNKKK